MSTQYWRDKFSNGYFRSVQYPCSLCGLKFENFKQLEEHTIICKQIEKFKKTNNPKYNIGDIVSCPISSNTNIIGQIYKIGVYTQNINNTINFYWEYFIDRNEEDCDGTIGVVKLEQHLKLIMSNDDFKNKIKTLSENFKSNKLNGFIFKEVDFDYNTQKFEIIFEEE